MYNPTHFDSDEHEYETVLNSSEGESDQYEDTSEDEDSDGEGEGDQYEDTSDDEEQENMNAIDDGDDEHDDDEVNMDINDYSVDELMNMFSITKPLNIENIAQSIEPHLCQHEGQSNMLSFLDKVKHKLISLIEDIKDVNLDVDISYPPIQTHNRPIEKGDVNPYMNHIHTRLICLDSQYRKMYWKTKSHDYISPLSMTMDNVISLQVEHIEIPNTWYVFHASKQNHIVNICGGSINKKIEISGGNYSSRELIESIQRKISNDIPSPSISFEYIPSSRKCQITNLSNDMFKINFQPESLPKNNTSFEISREKSLGHYLGFDESSSSFELTSSNDSRTGKHIVNTFGTKYIYVCIDDFTQNKTTNNIIGTSLNTDILSLPHYYNCDVSLGDPDGREKKVVLKGDKYYQLTHAQIHTINSIQKDISNVQNRGSYVNKSIDDGNVIAKIPVRHSPAFNEQIQMITIDKASETMKREYLGPVNIHKFRVYLLDDSGRELDLNGQDWSISLICKNHYRR